MKGRINLDYEHSPDPYDRHRALYLYLPTTEMTGDYTCKVSTLQNDVTGTKRMTVFGNFANKTCFLAIIAIPFPLQCRQEWFKSIRTEVTTSSRVSTSLAWPITSTQSLQSTFIGAMAPIGDKPFSIELIYFKLIFDQNKSKIISNLIRELLTGAIERAVQYHGGAWQKIVFVVLPDKSLRVENVFECVVKLPQTPYMVRRTMLYTPSKKSAKNECVPSGQFEN